MTDTEREQDALRQQRDISRLYAALDRNVNAIALEQLGLKLPILHTFKDDQGNTWAINVSAKLVKVESAPHE